MTWFVKCKDYEETFGVTITAWFHFENSTE